MKILILTTFAIILAFASINALINIISYSTKKEDIYKLSALFWVSLIINFILQAAAGENQLLIIASFSFSLIPVNLLCLSLHSIIKERYHTNYYLFTSITAVILSFLFCGLDIGFVYATLPLSFAAAIPLGFTAFKLFITKRNPKIFKFIGAILILFLVHGFNFAFFRMEENTQLWGWPIAYALYQAIAALLPIATLAEFHYRESSRMKDIIDQQTLNLELANKSLKNTVSFKNFLFRTLVHDIATPLLVSKASMETLKNKDNTLLTDSNMARIDRSINKMIQISSDLKSIETQKLDIRNCSVLECVLSCEEILSEMLENKKLKLVYNSHQIQKLGVYVHKSSFVNSVLSNLIRNSIKFSPRNQEIRISAGFEDEEHVWIVIQNMGQPIAEETLKNIFDFNSEKTKLGTDGEQGTGWGLPICKVFVDNYQGSLKLSSRPTEIPNLASIEAKLVIKGTKFNLETLSVG